MEIKRPVKNIIYECKDFALVKVKKQDNHKVQKNELILPSCEDVAHDRKLVWYNLDEEMVFLRGGFDMFVPRCYYEHQLNWAMGRRFYYDGNWIGIESDEEKEKKIELCNKFNVSPQMASIAWRHTKNKQIILKSIQNMGEYNKLFFIMEKVYPLQEIIEAVNDIPFLPTLAWEWAQVQPIDAVTQKLIEAQILDNRNAKIGTISYECLKCYQKYKAWIHWTDVDETKAFMIRQYEAKQRNKGLDEHLTSGEYVNIIGSMEIRKRYIIISNKKDEYSNYIRPKKYIDTVKKNLIRNLISRNFKS